MKGNINFGDKIKLLHKGNEIEGTFISFENGIITVKLNNGYNVALSDENTEVISSQAAKKNKEIRNEEHEVTDGVMILATGGTIASRVDYTTGAVKPHLDISSLIGDSGTGVNLGTKVIDNILSENVTPDKWISMATHAKREMDRGNHVVILHGTDTMTYSASALAFMFEKQSRSLTFTGSQRSPDRPSSDAFENIASSIAFSALNVGEVTISMHNSTSDFSERLLRATRSRKMHTTRRDAIRDIYGKDLARIKDGKITAIEEFRNTDEVSIISTKLDERVALVYFYPSFEPSTLSAIAESKRALVIMGTGLGHVSEGITKEIKRLTKDGIKVVMTSQCLAGNVNLNVYSTGRELKNAGVISAGDILPEVALTKTMYLMGNYEDQFDELMQIPIRREINRRLQN